MKTQTVVCESGLKGSQDKLQDRYEDLEEFVAYSETYDIHTRLGFASPQEAWEANPTLQSSTNPGDLRVVKAHPKG